jgi:hypothetical protein
MISPGLFELPDIEFVNGASGKPFNRPQVLWTFGWQQRPVTA